VALDFYRVTLTATTDSATTVWTYASFNQINRQIDGTDSSETSSGYIWQAQLEQASAATSYIPTTTAAVASDTITVYDNVFAMQSDSGITSWFDYYSEEIAYSADLVVSNMPLYPNPTIRIVVYSSTGAVSVGNCALGQTRDIGGTTYGAKAGIQDYSRKETDDFGNTSLIQRAYAKRSTFRSVVNNNQVDQVFDLLATLRATPIVWLGSDDYSMTWGYGWLRDWAIEVAFPTVSHLAIEMEGLT
jgi:hypothetical protein